MDSKVIKLFTLFHENSEVRDPILAISEENFDALCEDAREKHKKFFKPEFNSIRLNANVVEYEYLDQSGYPPKELRHLFTNFKECNNFKEEEVQKFKNDKWLDKNKWVRYDIEIILEEKQFSIIAWDVCIATIPL